VSNKKIDNNSSLSLVFFAFKYQKSYIPPFPNSNWSADTQYTQYFENFRVNKRAGGAPEPVLTNLKTPPNPRHHEPDPPRFTASPLHQSYLVAGKSPIHQGNGGNSSHGSSRQGNAHKPVDPNHLSYASPGPSKNSGSGRPHEGLIGYGTPGRNTPSRNKKMPSELVLNCILNLFYNLTVVVPGTGTIIIMVSIIA
jgi:hypothetical protein